MSKMIKRWPNDIINAPKQHEDILAKSGVSKCLSCMHYCKDGAKAQIRTVSGGDTTWYVGQNYCTILGYFPNRVMFSALNSPIGENGSPEPSPEVVECSEYTRGTFMKFRPLLGETDLEGAMTEAEQNFMDGQELEKQQLRKSTGVPKQYKEDKGFIPTMTSSIQFNKYGKADVPLNADEIMEIAMGPQKFHETKDFVINSGVISWINPAFKVGPHVQLTVKHTIKK